ncbi:hypothetical protein JOQ06_006710 [Pogonophryne albipinna]|uniref:SOWAHA-C winged helix-turn-helix domain-containing protein n=1 Tax=Pogonophryne albipinna TaxID=1090488 RepID=A0AAD6AXK5_9TELE|nr:hypothetical protein JOQ06_006710 [Pogonophryne albipinna]
MSGVSEESLLDYFYSTGGISGRVKNADILKTFKPFIGHSDVQLRAKYREEFKLIIDRIAAVKSENGEKYLVLKKKYRQMLQDRDARLHGTDGDAQRGSSPARAPAAAQWDASDPSTSSHQQKDPRDEPMLCGEQDEAAEQTGTASMQHAVLQLPVIQIQEPSNEDDELDKDSGSKSESEQDEESTGSMGSAAVALDPIEKEWIYSAAGARVPDLSELLRQDPSLANKKVTPRWIGSYVLTLSCGRGRPPSKSGPKPLPSPPGQDSMAAIEVLSPPQASLMFPLALSLSLFCRVSQVIVEVSVSLATTSLGGDWWDVLSDWTGGGTPAGRKRNERRRKGRRCILSVLVHHPRPPGDPPSRLSNGPLTALHWAAKHGNQDMAALVANAGADVNTKSGYTPLHIAALHGHRHILDLLIVTYGAKENLRDYSGHLAGHYLNIREPEGPEEECELQFQVTQARERNRNRKLASLFHSKKRWGSAEELAPIEEERTASHQLILPAFRPRKFSR